ncbi:MAG TPA: hypothetical protein VH741_02910, partial [Candidatus Limnocylindrales bacterium]
MSPTVLAHVIYVTPPEPSPDPLGFLLGVLSDPFALLVLAGGGLAGLALVGLWLRWSESWAP